MNPLITIIVPVYNTEKYLLRCFDSIANQTYENIEVILINDGSTDNSACICDKYAAKDSRFRVLHTENQGVSKARNEALRIAKGEYIGFVDSDDTIESDMYEFLYKKIVEFEAEIAICGTKVLNDSGEEANTNLKQLTVFSREEAVEKLLQGQVFTGSPCDRIFKRKIIEDLYFPEDIFNGEDGVFVLAAILNSKKIVVAPECKYNYIKRMDSASNSSFSEKLFTYYFANKRMLEMTRSTRNCKLIEIAHTTQLVADNFLLQKLCENNQVDSKYRKILQKDIRENFKVNRLSGLAVSQKVCILACCLNFKFFLVINFLRVNIKLFLEKLGLRERKS